MYASRRRRILEFLWHQTFFYSLITTSGNTRMTDSWFHRIINSINKSVQRLVRLLDRCPIFYIVTLDGDTPDHRDRIDLRHPKKEWVFWRVVHCRECVLVRQWRIHGPYSKRVDWIHDRSWIGVDQLLLSWMLTQESETRDTYRRRYRYESTASYELNPIDISRVSKRRTTTLRSSLRDQHYEVHFVIRASLRKSSSELEARFQHDWEISQE